jgi:hypothetical protein
VTHQDYIKAARKKHAQDQKDLSKRIAAFDRMNKTPPAAITGAPKSAGAPPASTSADRVFAGIARNQNAMLHRADIEELGKVTVGRVKKFNRVLGQADQLRKSQPGIIS